MSFERWPLALLAVGASIVVWPGADTFELPKLAIVIGALAASMPHLIRSTRLVDRQLFGALVAVVLSHVVSLAILGPSPTALWGSEARVDGLIGAGVGLLVFVAAARSGPWVIPWWILGVAMAAVYAVVQKMGLDPVPWELDHVPALAYRPFSTMGSPSFLAISLAMGLPVLMSLSARPWVVAMLGFLFALVLALTMSRAGIAAGAVGLFVAALARKPLPIRTLAVPVVCGLACGAFWSGQGAPTSAAQRFAVDGGSGEVRLELARSGLRAFAQSPIVGIGPGATAAWLAEDRRANLTKVQRRNPSFHNWLLDAGAQRGVLGLFATLWLVLAAGSAARGPVAGGLAAFLVGVMFGFPTTATWLPACLLLGIVGGADANSPPGAGSTPRSPTC